MVILLCLRLSQCLVVSVLALSSRFDGPGSLSEATTAGQFQYSLCRVVLMVASSVLTCAVTSAVSVLALSSRFDGHI